MLRRVITCVALSFYASIAFAAPQIGKPAPSFSAQDVITGKTVSLEKLKGKIVVLEWNNFGCPFVKKFYDSNTMQQLQADAKKQDVVWVSVNSSAQGKEGYLADATLAKAALTTAKSNAAHYILDHDGTIGHAYDAKTTPHMFVIDAKGLLAYMGAIDSKPSADASDIASATNYVTEALQALKAGQPVKTTNTRSYGCFVKYQ